jgi:AraC-like DNA-binding protein
MSSLIEILDSKVIPWSTGQSCLVMAGPTLGMAELPDGVRVTKRKLRGLRRAVRANRKLERISYFTATWPEDRLVEKASVPVLICVLGGRVDYQVGEYVIHCGEGRFILVPPGAPHENGSQPHYKQNPEQPSGDYCDLLCFERYRRSILCWTCHSAGAQHGVRPGLQYAVTNDAAAQLLDLVFDEAENLQDGWQEICQDQLHAFLKIIRREVKNSRGYQGDLIVEPEAQARPLRNRIEEAQQYVRAHLRHPLTIEKVARHVYMSRTEFTRSFRRQTGQSFSEFLTQCRLEEAQALLRDSNWSVTKIGERIGLKSLSYFCALFQQHFGLTPQKFRDQVMNDKK